MGDLRTVAGKRLDGLVDGAFAFSITIMIVGTGDAMNSYDGLLATFAHVPAFAISLLVILSFWWAHRQLGSMTMHGDWVNDALSIFVMFVILIYVFPLSFLARSLLHWLSDAALPGTGLLPFQIRSVYEIFGIGFGILSGIYALMYTRLAKSAGVISINKALYTPHRFRPAAKRASIFWMLWAVAALFSICVALFGGLDRLIWLPLLPYGVAVVIAFISRIRVPLAPQSPLNDEDITQWQRLTAATPVNHQGDQ